jgi:hypothetical protein
MRAADADKFCGNPVCIKQGEPCRLILRKGGRFLFAISHSGAKSGERDEES